MNSQSAIFWTLPNELQPGLRSPGAAGRVLNAASRWTFAGFADFGVQFARTYCAHPGWMLSAASCL